MNTQAPVAAAGNGGDIIEAVITAGDLDKLTPQDRTRYYVKVCESVGLNPLTQPFAYIRLNGKLVLYALRGCTDQLRTIHGVSVEEMSESERAGVFVVTCKVRNKEGRTDMAKGAVPLGDLKGEALANALMKAETKAKRRATLSICGLGILDESEVDSITPVVQPLEEKRTYDPGEKINTPQLSPKVKPLPAPKVREPVYDPETGEVGPHYIAVETEGGIKRYIPWGGKLFKALEEAKTRTEGEEWVAQNANNIAECAQDHPKVHERVEAAIAAMRLRFSEPPPDFMAAE